MKVLLVEPFARHQGHFRPYVCQLATALSSTGVRVHVFSPSELGDLPGVSVICHPGDWITNLSWLKRIIFLYRFLLIADQVRFIALASIKARQLEADLIHVTSIEPLSFSLAVALVRFLGIWRRPVVGTLHETKLIVAKESLIRRVQLKCLRHGLHSGALFITVNGKQIRNDLSSLLGVSVSDSLRYVPYGAHAAGTGTRHTMREARQILNIPKDSFMLLVFGMLSRYKNYASIIKAVSRLPHHVLLLIAGAPGDVTREELVQMVTEHKVNHRVVLRTDWVPEELVPAYFCAADLVLVAYTSRDYWQSGPLFQALAYGIPVLATTRGVIGEVIKGCGAALEWDPASGYQGLIEGIQLRMVMEPEAVKAMTGKAADLSREFSWHEVAIRFKDLYYDMVSDPARQDSDGVPPLQ